MAPSQTPKACEFACDVHLTILACRVSTIYEALVYTVIVKEAKRANQCQNKARNPESVSSSLVGGAALIETGSKGRQGKRKIECITVGQVWS